MSSRNSAIHNRPRQISNPRLCYWRCFGRYTLSSFAIRRLFGSKSSIPYGTCLFSSRLPNLLLVLVTDASSFSSDIHQQGYDGLMGLGPNSGSQVYDKIDSDAGDSVLTSIFNSNKSSSNFISFLLDRHGDPSETFTGQFTISEYIPGFENITSMPQMDVETVLKLLDSGVCVCAPSVTC